ncbi:MAG TPA: aminotransferase class V-fold PLP-dependent enzyme [Thermomicrobiales bacterium]|nr:aminotransferase class V-fold PLP-dependent enzyme [Thermomicrobiales bacterium]
MEVGVYERLGVRRVINADATLTRLGGSLIPSDVFDAMREAAGSFVDIYELQEVVGKRLAELTRNEAAYVSTGAAAGIVLATLAAMTDGDLPTIARLIETGETPKDEVIIQRVHRIPYDPAIRLAGARIVDVGNRLQTFPWELEAAITPRTAMIFYAAGDHLASGALSLPQTIEIAHSHGVPVVVDAAAQLPPTENLWRFTQELGADAAVFSGGKDFWGPQASGLIVGTKKMISAIAVNGSPHQRLARPLKVGKEEMIGLLAAVERYVGVDWRVRAQRYEETVARWVEHFQVLPGISAQRVFPNEAGQPTPRCRIAFAAESGVSGPEAVRLLWEGTPRISVAVDGPEAISITPELLAEGEEAILLDRIGALARSPVGVAD